MLSCHLCLLISCDSLVFWILSFDCSFCLIAWYLYFLLYNIARDNKQSNNYISCHFHGYNMKRVIVMHTRQTKAVSFCTNHHKKCFITITVPEDFVIVKLNVLCYCVG